MGLRAFYAKQDDIPEDQRSLYVEKDGKWMLDVDAVDGIALVDGTNLKSALDKERAAAKKAQDALKVFEGLDAESARAAMKKLEELGDLDSIDDLDEKYKQQVELAKAQAKDAYTREIQKVQDKAKTDLDAAMQRAEASEKQLRTVTVRNAALQAIEQHGGSKSRAMLLPLIESRTVMERQDDGSYVTKVLDESGNPMTTAESGEFRDMGIEEFVGTLKSSSDFAHAFEGSQASGSGAGSGSGSGGGTGGTGSGGGNERVFQRGQLTNPEVFADYKAAREAQDAGNGPAVKVVD